MKKLLSVLLCGLLLTSCAAAENTSDAASHVTYEIFVASFADHDGDGRGDLLGIVDKLDYLEALGVDRLWLMPVHPSPSYHKYDVTDYEAIDPAYGTLADFDTLTSSCAARGMGVTLDLVVNHTSKEHPWFKAACAALAAGEDSPYIDWYHFTQGEGQHPVPNAEGWFYEGQFGDHMPDLNLDSAEVRGEIAKIVTFWQSHGVTGFRLDAVTSYYTGADKSNADFLTFLTQTAKANDPACTVTGEAWTDAQSILNLYASGVDSLFNFPMADNDGRFVKSALNGTGAAAATALAEWNDKLHAASADSFDSPFLSNHDMARVRGSLRSDVTKMKIAAMLYLLAPGQPTVYYGEELGMSGAGRDENKRLPMVWSTAEGTVLCAPPADADQEQRLKEGADAQDKDADSLLNCYRHVIALRKSCPELYRGTMEAIEAGNDAVAWVRVTEDDSTVNILINASDKESAVIAVQDGTLMGSYGAAELSADGLTLGAASCAVLR